MSKVLLHLSVIEDRLNKIAVIIDLFMMVAMLIFLAPIMALIAIIVGNCLLWGLRNLCQSKIDKRRRIVRRRELSISHLRKR
jgi:hypothetical protein